MLDDFKDIVDNCSATIFSIDDSLKINEELGIDTAHGYSSIEIINKFSKNVKDLLKVEGDISEKIKYAEFIDFETELIYKYVIYDEDPIKYLNILNIIKDFCRGNGKYLPAFSNENWKKAIINCKNYSNFSDVLNTSVEKLKESNPKDFNRAKSLKILVKKGCKIKIEKSNVEFISGLDSIIKVLEKKIDNFGGLSLMQALFKILAEYNYSEKFERYFIIREMGFNNSRERQIPYGFLLNLALKYPKIKNKTKNPQKLLKEIIDLAIIITNGVYDVQYYNVFGYIFQSGDKLTNFIQDVVLWDSIFSIPQCRPSSAIDICDNLFSFIDVSIFENVLGFSKEEFIIVVNWLYEIDVNSPTIIHLPNFIRINGLNDEKVIKILDFMAHDLDVNNSYFFPDDHIFIDFGQKPLVKLMHRGYLCADPFWIAPNFFESLATPFRDYFRDQGKNFDSELGKQLETFLQEKLKKNNIHFINGEYNVDGVEGECDFLIESKEAIILIEFKKKVLTRKSKSGLDYNILIDLANSLLSSQCQAGRTEIILRENEKISLKSENGDIKTVYLNNRYVERVSLTQLEFGAFQDHNIVKTFLQSLLSYSYKINSAVKTLSKKFEELEVERGKWVEQYNKLISFDENLDRNLFFHCYFMSLPQLIEIINLSSDNDSFYEFLTKNRFMSLSTFDWYFEFDKLTRTSEKEK